VPLTPYTRPADGQVRLLTKVARMYHERGVRQADIAAALNISQAKVSRLLKRAETLGIVRTIVTVAPGVYAELEDQLEERYGLAEAVLDLEGSPEETLSPGRHTRVVDVPVEVGAAV
jgi:DNA-binding transcriptional regulator LsrR (DeoR family)